MSCKDPAPQIARDLKRSALAVAMVLLKELDEAVPEEHGAQAIAALLLKEKRAPDRASAFIDVTDEHVDAVLLAVTGTIGRLLNAVDDKCPEGPLKPMLLFKIVEELAQEGYDIDCVVDFVRQAHAGASRQDEPSLRHALTGIAPPPPSVNDVISEGPTNPCAGAALRPSHAA
jgi:hypothetical protein